MGRKSHVINKSNKKIKEKKRKPYFEAKKEFIDDSLNLVSDHDETASEEPGAGLESTPLDTHRHPANLEKRHLHPRHSLSPVREAAV